MEINVLEEMSKPTLDIIGRAGFGYEFNAVSNSEATSALYAHFSAVTDRFQIKNWIQDKFFPFVKYFVRAEWETHLNVVQSKKALERACREMVEARLKESLDGDGKDDVGDLLSVFLKANREIKDVQSRLSDEELGAQVLTFLLAGHETTSVALTWTLDFLSKNPEIQGKLREELKLDMAHSDADPSLDLITSSGNYLDAVFKESLRLATPAPMTMRKCLNDDVLDGFKIPKGTTISISPDIMHKLPDIWGPDVLDFKPERWLDIGKQEEDDPRRTFGSFMPFMLGPRNCIGAKFATYEYKAILAVLVRNFEFVEVEGQRIRKIQHLTVKPEPDIRLTLTACLSVVASLLASTALAVPAGPITKFQSVESAGVAQFRISTDTTETLLSILADNTLRVQTVPAGGEFVEPTKPSIVVKKSWEKLAVESKQSDKDIVVSWANENG
ncbi:hypothetical protein HDU99_003377, partial [Rhizoclosmatium hyalinum]